MKLAHNDFSISSPSKDFGNVMTDESSFNKLEQQVQQEEIQNQIRMQRHKVKFKF